MKRATTLFVLLLLVVMVFQPIFAQSGGTEAVVDGNNQFAFELYQALATDSDGNLIFSPYSISQAFAMVSAGANGNTQQQLLDTFHFPTEDLNMSMAELNENLTNRAPVLEDEGQRFQFNVANSLWMQDGFPFLADYIALLEEYYNGALNTVDFIQATEETRQAINTWIEEQTQDKIQDMIPEGVLTTDTRLVLVNAIYFNASWLNAFNEEATQDAPFTLLDNSTVSVPMMNQSESLLFAQGEGYSAVSLPYLGGDMAMLAIMPDDFATFEATLDAETFAEIQASLGFGQVNLAMPRFSYESQASLVDSLTALGMTDAFDPDTADFTGIFDRDQVGQNLYISDALHKAFIAVDEAGTEAAAATAVIFGVTSAPAETVDITLDHPFIYAIYDQQTGSILFLGRVLNPATT